MKIKRDALSGLGVAIERLNVKGAKFSYALVKNKGKIDKELKIIQEVVDKETSKEEKEFDKARVELVKSNSNKDKKGEAKLKANPMTGRQEYDVKDMDKFNKEFEKLQKEHSKAIELIEKRKTDLDKLLAEEIEIDFHLIKEENIPEEITPQQLSTIAVLLD